MFITDQELRMLIRESLLERHDEHWMSGLSESEIQEIIRKLGPKKYRLYSKKKNPKSGERRNLGTFRSKKAAKEHEQDIQFFKRRG